MESGRSGKKLLHHLLKDAMSLNQGTGVGVKRRGQLPGLFGRENQQRVWA